MDEKITNRAVLERVATEFLGVTDPDQIEACVNEFIFCMLLD